MIEANSKDTRYQTLFTNGKHSAISDTTRDKGGNESGFRPHDLLEAALASCINMTLRMYADQQGIPLSGVTTRVRLDRSNPEESVFECEIEFLGSPAENDREHLLEIAEKCPVHQTLSKRIKFCTR